MATSNLAATFSDEHLTSIPTSSWHWMQIPVKLRSVTPRRNTFFSPLVGPACEDSVIAMCGYKPERLTQALLNPIRHRTSARCTENPYLFARVCSRVFVFSYQREIVLRSSASHDYLVCGMSMRSEVCIFERYTAGAGVRARHTVFLDGLTTAL